MPTGSQSDFVGRLQAWLPTRWFPTEAQNVNGSVPRIYALLSGAAAAFAQVWNQLQYARTQTRASTSTDGWLDLASEDFFGGTLPRLPGETDPAFQARIKANLFLPANTRAAIEEAVEKLTGYPARMIEPWQPNDNARYGSSFYGYNTVLRPGQYANGNQRYRGLIQTSLPAGGISGLPHRGYGNAFYGSAGYAPGGAFYLQQSPEQGTSAQVNAVINKLRSIGISVFIQFIPPPSTGEVLATESGAPVLTNADGQEILIG